MPYAGPISGKFAYTEFVQDWPELITATNELEARLRREGRTEAADVLLRSYGELRDDLLALGQRMAVFATETLQRVEKNTRVRPDTHGADGTPRLADSLVAEPLPHQDLLPGSIGVADMEVLDNRVPWWITNEIGSSANVGRLLYGFFYGQDDEAAPARSEFRVHPLFQTGWSPVSGGGIIEEPIPARRFIEKSVPIINSEWQAGFASAKQKFNAGLSLALRTMR